MVHILWNVRGHHTAKLICKNLAYFLKKSFCEYSNIRLEESSVERLVIQSSLRIISMFSFFDVDGLIFQGSDKLESTGLFH